MKDMGFIFFIIAILLVKVPVGKMVMSAISGLLFRSGCLYTHGGGTT